MQTLIEMRLHFQFMPGELRASVFLANDPDVDMPQQQNVHQVAFCLIRDDFIDV